ncbi:hypothetical protein IWW52_001823 [Coemansia sp. RSA 2704]|nr:hypothetical protein IWW52_001823 [Coemansia sp. RSA 2704]
MWLLARGAFCSRSVLVRSGMLRSLHAHARASVAVAWGAFVDRYANCSAKQRSGIELHARARPTRLALDRLFGCPPDACIRVRAVGAGMRHALVAGEVLGGASARTVLAGFGLNSSWQLGKPSVDDSIDRIGEPVVCAVDGTVTQIACGREHSAMVVRRHDGIRRVLVCGNNAYGQLGLAAERSGGDHGLPRHGINELTALSDVLGGGEEPVKVQCGLDHTVVLTSRGRVFAMGWGDDGQLGTGLQTSSKCPVLVAGLEGTPIADISSTTDFTLALAVDGRLFYWGNAEYGQCMVGRKIDRVLARMNVSFGGGRIKAVAAGGCHSLLLTEAGQVYACGYGALGLGPDKLAALEPTLIGGLDGVEAILASTDRCLAIDNERRVYSWGLGNSAGRLGNGSAAANVFSPEALSIDPALVSPSMTALGNDIAIMVS